MEYKSFKKDLLFIGYKAPNGEKIIKRGFLKQENYFRNVKRLISATRDKEKIIQVSTVEEINSFFKKSQSKFLKILG